MCFTLVFYQTVYSQTDSIKTKTNYIGSNITRMIVGDFELEIRHRLNKDIMVGISAGYDFNFLDPMFSHSEGLDKEFYTSVSVESQTNPESRYMWGEGIAARVHVDYTFPSKGEREHFISFEGLWKERNYTDHHFGEARWVISESAEQTIKGFTLYYGTNRKINKHLIYRFHTGIGFRVLNSKIKRPEYTFDGVYHDPSEFPYKLTIPSLHLGVTMLLPL